MIRTLRSLEVFAPCALAAMFAACGGGSRQAADGAADESTDATAADGAGGAEEAGGVPDTGGETDAGAGGAGDRDGNGGTGGCAPPLAPPLVGWAAVTASGVATTTGGGAATPTVVRTLAELNRAAAGTTPTVIWLEGSLAGTVTVGSNKSIVGACGAEIRGHVEISGSANVIVRNLKIVGFGVGDCALDPGYDPTVGCSSGADAVTIQKNAHHVWIDHCDISDGTDGNLDVTNGANYVTVSWTKFHYTPRADDSGNDSTGPAGHRYSNLVGGTDTPSTYDDASSLNVTWHHNWWADNVDQRQPRVRFGKNHIFNNLYTSADNRYCVRAAIGAKLLIENNAFVGVNNPHEFNGGGDESTASIISAANLYVDTSGTTATGGGGVAFTSPPYPYAADPASAVQDVVLNGAGPK